MSVLLKKSNYILMRGFSKKKIVFLKKNLYLLEKRSCRKIEQTLDLKDGFLGSREITPWRKCLAPSCLHQNLHITLVLVVPACLGQYQRQRQKNLRKFHCTVRDCFKLGSRSGPKLEVTPSPSTKQAHVQIHTHAHSQMYTHILFIHIIITPTKIKCTYV